MNESSEESVDDEVVLSVRRLSPIANLTFRKMGALGEGELVLVLRILSALVSDLSKPGCLVSTGSGRRCCFVDSTRRSSAFPPLTGTAIMGFSCGPLFDTAFCSLLLPLLFGFCMPLCCACTFGGAITRGTVFKVFADIFGIYAIFFGE